MMDSIAAWAGAAAVLIVVAVAAAIRAIRRARRRWMRRGRTRQLLGQWGAEARLQQLEADLEAAWLAGDRAVVRSVQRARQIENLKRTNKQLTALLEIRDGARPLQDDNGTAAGAADLKIGPPDDKDGDNNDRDGEGAGEPLRRVVSIRGITIPISEQEAARITTVAADRGMSTAEFVEQMFRAGMVATETATAGGPSSLRRLAEPAATAGHRSPPYNDGG